MSTGASAKDLPQPEDSVNTLAGQFNGLKTSLSLSDPFVVQVFEDNLRKVIGDGIDLLFCNSGEVRSFTQTHSTEAAAEQLEKYTKTFVITRGAGGSLSYDGTALAQIRV